MSSRGAKDLPLYMWYLVQVKVLYSPSENYYEAQLGPA